MIVTTFLIGFSTAFFLIFAIHILCFRKNRTHYQTLLGCIMAVWAVWSMKDIVLVFPGMYVPEVTRWIMIVDGWMALTYTALVFETTMPGWLSWRKALLFCMPFILFTVLYALWQQSWVTIAYAVFLWCFAWIVIGVGYQKARRHIRYVRENFSDIEEIDLQWLPSVFLFVIIGQLLWLFISLFSTVVGDVLYYLVTLSLWLLVLYYSWNFRPIEIVANKSEAVHPVKEFGFAGELEHTIEQQQLYLNKTLTLADLAQAVGSNRTYVSAYLMQVKGLTFYDYINQLRIEKKSIPLMQEHPEYTLEHMAHESGFNSVSTFRRAFVKYTGKTPSAYLRN